MMAEEDRDTVLSDDGRDCENHLMVGQAVEST
jgi:hypothetical protein